MDAGRRCFIMELDEKYCSTIIERWESSTGNKGVKL
jgi:DNA modification methylase